MSAPAATRTATPSRAAAQAQAPGPRPPFASSAAASRRAWGGRPEPTPRDGGAAAPTTVGLWSVPTEAGADTTGAATPAGSPGGKRPSASEKAPAEPKRCVG